MKNKLGRNDPCWCGSGKKYKKCHRIRSNETILPFGALVHNFNKQSKISTCLHPDASAKTCNKVIDAHTLQRSRVLRAISNGKNKVLTFFPPEIIDDENLKVHEKGWKEAATFSAFCKNHDDETFAYLEKTNFDGTKKEIFLIAYRAVCWEMFQKMRAVKGHPTLRDTVDRGKPLGIQSEIQNQLAVSNYGYQKGLEDFKYMKEVMDSSLVSGGL